MKRIFIATTVAGVIVILASPRAQRKTGDDTVRLAQATRQAAADGIMMDRRLMCMKAIGSAAFCDCINGALPLAVDFQRYIRITTTTGELASTDRQVADVVLATRDRCVATVFSGRK